MAISHHVLEAHICEGANALGETLEAVARTGAQKIERQIYADVCLLPKKFTGTPDRVSRNMYHTH